MFVTLGPWAPGVPGGPRGPGYPCKYVVQSNSNSSYIYIFGDLHLVLAVRDHQVHQLAPRAKRLIELVEYLGDFNLQQLL